MQAFLLAIVAAVLLWVGVVAYNSSAGDRRMAEARAYAIERQADADAAATRQMAMIPVLMVVGTTIVGVIFGIGFIVWARRPQQTIVYQQPPHQLPRMTRPELLAAVEQYIQLQREYTAQLPAEVVDGECRRY